MSLVDDFRNKLIESSEVLALLPNAATDIGVVQYLKNEYEGDTAPTTRIWFRRSSREKETNNTGVELLTRTDLEIEIISEDIELAEDLSEVMYDILNDFAGTMGSTCVCLMSIQDQDDDYQYYNLGEDDGLYIVAQQVNIIT